MKRRAILASLAVLAAALAAPALAQLRPADIGIVVMHGKGGGPTRLVAGLARWLGEQGYLVANPEMPWSGRRNYDVPVPAAVAEVDAAIASLRARGARKVVVCGHSLGGLFALHYAGQRQIDALVAIAPGGDVSSPFLQGKLGPAFGRARRMVAEGRGAERATFDDYENARNLYPLETNAAAYASWFDPAGAMNQGESAAAVKPSIPVLYIVPVNDYPGLLRVKDLHFKRLPGNPGTRLVEPEATHTTAPWESREAIARWLREVLR